MTPPNRIAILMVEDDPAHEGLAQRALLEAGLVVVITRVETQETFEFQLKHEVYDIILSDYRLPTFNGLEALGRARIITPSIPFIFVTGTLGEEVAIETLKIGATDYVLKKHLTRLGPSVRRALQEGLERKERQCAERKLLQSNEQLRALTAHLQQVREEERTRIARQVHDELGQALTGLKLELSWLVSDVVKTDERLAQKVSALTERIDGTIQTVRRISTELRPGILDNLGLAAAIEWQAQDFQQRTGIRCTVTVMSDESMWSRELSTTFFRIFQEALTNIIRHAEASHVEVVLSMDSGQLILSVQDNGKGISDKAIHSSQSIGLIGMRERAALLGGSALFIGDTITGTRITVCIPLPPTEPNHGVQP